MMYILGNIHFSQIQSNIMYYLLNFLKEDKKYIKIYSLYSGSLLNIVDFPNVEAISIYDKCLKEDNINLSFIYDLISKAFPYLLFLLESK